MNEREEQLLRAVKADDIDSVWQLLETGIDANFVSDKGTPLVIYVESVSCLRLLARFGVNLKAATSDGWTALHRAGRNASDLASEWLRVFGTPDVPDVDGETPLFHAVRFREYAFATLLLENGANPNVTNNDTEPMIHIAALLGDRQMIQLLLDYGALIDLPNANRDTALMIAAYHDKWLPETVVDLLLNNGASRELRSTNGWTALDNARATGSERAIDLLSRENLHSECSSHGF